MRSKPVSRHDARGFSLIEICMCLLIVGIAVSGATLSATHYVKAQKVEATQEKIALIENALSSYVQQYYRLPCPADPGITGTTMGMEKDPSCFTDNVASSNTALYGAVEGILPWKELGLSQDMALDAWGRYITYKPAPQLTVDTVDSLAMQDSGFTPSLTPYDVHNACRTEMWYDGLGNQLNRAKALFCCNSAAYHTAKPNSDWQQNGIVDTATANAMGAPGGSSLPAGKAVAMTGNWMDPVTTNIEQGTFGAYNSSKPQPPLIRATGLAVTLISHGPKGDLAFLPGQAMTKLYGGATLNTGTYAVTAGTNVPQTEQDNAGWPQIFGGVLGLQKVSDGSFNPLGSAGASDDIVSYLRSDDLFGRVGNASCEKPPLAVFAPAQACKPTAVVQMGTSVHGLNTMALQMEQIQGANYMLQTTGVQEHDGALFHSSVGIYTFDLTTGQIQSVQMLATDMKTAQWFQSLPPVAIPQTGTGNVGIGSFIVQNGAMVNGGVDPAIPGLASGYSSYVTDPASIVQTHWMDPTNPDYIDPTQMMFVVGFTNTSLTDEMPTPLTNPPGPLPYTRLANITTDAGLMGQPGGISLVAPIAKGPNKGKLVEIVGQNGDGPLNGFYYYLGPKGINPTQAQTGYGAAPAPVGPGNGIFVSNSNLNEGEISDNWRDYDTCNGANPNAVAEGFNCTRTFSPQELADFNPNGGSTWEIGMNDQSHLNCWYTDANDDCSPSPAYTSALPPPAPAGTPMDSFGGYIGQQDANGFTNIVMQLQIMQCVTHD